MGISRLAVLVAVLALLSGCGDTTPVSTRAVDAVGTTVTDQEPSDSSHPPPLIVTSDGLATTVPGFDYCWESLCGDMFGTEIPSAISVDSQTVTLDWVEDGELQARVRSDDAACSPRLSLESTGPGSWILAVSPEAGAYRVDLAGTAPDGTSRFALLVTSSVDGPPTRPVATVWWPETDDPFLLSVEISAVGADGSAVLGVVSADGISTDLQLELRASGRRCDLREGEVWIDNLPSMGTAPYTANLGLTDNTGRYSLSWEWPLDHREDGTLTGTMDPQD